MSAETKIPAPDLDPAQLQRLAVHAARQNIDEATRIDQQVDAAAGYVYDLAVNAAGRENKEIVHRGMVTSRSTVGRAAERQVLTTETTTHGPDIVLGEFGDHRSTIFPIGEPTENMTSKETLTDSLGLGILGRPDHTKVNFVRTTTTKSKPRTKSGLAARVELSPDAHDGSGSVIEETIEGSRRIVHRRLQTGVDHKGRGVIRVTQRSVDRNNQEGTDSSVREETWVHDPADFVTDPELPTADPAKIKEAKIAREIAKAMTKRTTSRARVKRGFEPAPKSVALPVTKKATRKKRSS